MTTDRRPRPTRLLAATVVVVVGWTGLGACGGDETSTPSSTTAETTTTSVVVGIDPVVSEPWVRAADAGGNSAAYLTITGGAQADALVSASVPEDVATEAQLHETTSSGGDTSGGMGAMMGMEQVREVPIPAGGTVALEPGGYHIMLVELTDDLTAGAQVPVTLTFSSGRSETVDAEVRVG